MSTPREEPRTHTYTACGEPELEARVVRDLSCCVDRLLELLPRDAAVGIALSGAYGRGEGGAWWRGEELLPYDDYELYIVSESLSRRDEERLSLDVRTVAVELSGRVGVRVQIRVLDRATVRRPPATRAMADLRAGHRVLVGPPALLRSMPGPEPEALPPIEATRLVLAGVSRLTRARAALPRLEEASVVARVAREVRTAWLAAGDGWLIAARRYHPSLRERLSRVWREATHGALREGYLAAGRELQEGARAPESGALPQAIEEAAAALDLVLADVERVRVGAPLPGGSREEGAAFRFVP